MKKLIAFLIIASLFVPAFAGIYNSVPQDHEVYRIIETAEIRGIIPIQSDVKPYDYTTIMNLLKQISASSDISYTESVELSRVMKSLESSYGHTESKTLDSVLKNGYWRTSNDKAVFTVGVKGYLDEAAGILLNGFTTTGMKYLIDSRNTGTFYFNVDAFKNFSFDMNASLLLDLPSSKAYLPNEFLYDCDGDYFISLGKSTDKKLSEIEAKSDYAYVGIKANPELAASFFDGDLLLRFATVKRDWGPARGNLVLSSYASTFPAIEITAKPFDWLNFSVLTGSLVRASFYSIDGVKVPGYRKTYEPDEVEKCDGKEVAYNNNFSLQRIEFALPHNAKFSLFESVVWKKRFELGYLNPLSIYWFQQTLAGDADNIAGGCDFSITLPGNAKFYAALSIDEFTADLKHLLTAARNVVALQGGVKMPARFFDSAFGNCTAQVTYVPPFYGTHYYDINPDVSPNPYSLSYVNRGFALGYPLDPDSLEIYVDLDLNYENGWNIFAMLKDQLSSAQYALESYNGDGKDWEQYGNNLFTVCYYGAGTVTEAYQIKLFSSYIWKNVTNAKLQFTKKMEKAPVELSFGLEAIAVMTRYYDVLEKNLSKVPEWDKEQYGTQYNNGTATKVFDAWNTPELRAIGNIGVKVYF